MGRTSRTHLSSTIRIALVAFIALTGIAAQASAQDKRVGLVIGYPTSVGVLWQVSDRLALRGEGTYTWSSSRFGGGSDLDADPTSQPQIVGGATLTFFPGSLRPRQKSHYQSGSLGISALITLAKTDRFRTYVAPRFAVGLSRSILKRSYDLTSLPANLPAALLSQLQPETIKSSSTTPLLGGLFGATAAIGERMGVFGEVGINYTRSSGFGFDPDSKTHTVGVRSGVGVVLFF